MSETRTDYKATVFLPRTDFPMRGELPKREPELLSALAGDGAVAAIARGRRRARRNSSCMTGRLTPTAICISATR